MKVIKENWKLALIVVAGIVAVIFMCIFGIQGAQNKAFALEEQVNTADSDIKVQEKVDLVYNLADCVKQYDKHEAETLTAIVEGRGKATSIEKEYNRYVRKFPTRFFLNILGYETQQYQYLDYDAPVDAPQNLFGD